jgi:AGZA family xanthine/uracil permease-like MFS transporter
MAMSGEEDYMQRASRHSKTVAVAVDKYFEVTDRGSSILGEFKAATTTFLTSAYILLANPQILSVIGIAKTDAVLATAISAACGSLVCGVLGNLPFSVASGLGLSAYITYGVVLSSGLAVDQAYTCSFMAGVLFLLCSAFGITEFVMKIIPTSVKLGTIVGMGLLIALIGMVTTKLVVPNEHTIIGLGPMDTDDAMFTIGGLALIVTLLFYEVNGSILISIFAITIVKWIMSGDYPEQFVSFPTLQSGPSDYINFSNLEWSTCLTPTIAMLCVALFDVGGVVYGISSMAGLQKADNTVPGASGAFAGCAVGSIIGAMMGTTFCIVYVESAAGIRDGAKTGLSSVFVALYFFSAIFFAPVFSQIPSCATSPVLIVVGAMMMSQTRYIEWDDMTKAVPAFFTLIMMPFTYSINNGIAFGIGFSILFYFTTGQIFRDVHKLYMDYRDGNSSNDDEITRSPKTVYQSPPTERTKLVSGDSSSL